MGEAHWKLAGVFIIIWTVSLLYGEWASFWMYRCTWPVLTNAEGKIEPSPVKVAIIADPELVDRTTYNLPPNAEPPLHGRLLGDIFLRRAFVTRIVEARPDFMFVLGDLFHGGHILKEREFQVASRRFFHIFNEGRPINQGQNWGHEVAGKGLKKFKSYQVSGNRDVGPVLGQPLQSELEAAARFESTFNQLETAVPVGAASFVILDSLAMEDEASRPRQLAALAFLKHIADGAQDRNVTDRPTVLLTHLPLFPPEGFPACRGPVQVPPGSKAPPLHAGPLHRYGGLNETTTKFLLSVLKPVQIFSGHTHQACAVNHRTLHGASEERIVGSFSGRGSSPSYLLVSVAPALPPGIKANRTGVIAAQLCHLPSLENTQRWYLFLGVLTVVTMMMWPPRGRPRFISSIGAAMADLGRNLMKGQEKLKVDAEDEEMEMVWDAEGNMHLIKAAASRKDTEGNTSSARNGAQVRLTAVRRQAVSEIEEIIPVERLDGVDLPRPATSSKAKAAFRTRLVNRLLDVFGPLALVTAIELMLFAALVQRDWTGDL